MPPTKFMIRQAQKFGKKKGIRPSDLLDLMEHESGFDPGAVSSAGARGLTQFMPTTAPSYDVQFGTSKKAQKTQIRGAARFLKAEGWDQTEAGKREALAAYYGAASPYADDLLQSEAYKKYDKGAISTPSREVDTAGQNAAVPKLRKKSSQAPPTAMTSESAKHQLAAAKLAFINDPEKTVEDYAGIQSTIESMEAAPPMAGKLGVKKEGKDLSFGGKAPSIAPLPKSSNKMVKWAASKLGTQEGSKSWAGSSSFPWCSVFVAEALKKSGVTQMPTNPAHSSSWLSWGGGSKVGLKQIAAGDIVVFDWGDGGETDHVAIYAGNGQVIGGNQSNAVTKVPLDRNSVVGVVRPNRSKNRKKK